MKYVVAVSGGVDSVVLLDMLASRHKPDQLIVAHFEHGIRGKDSENDAEFVKLLSKKYRLKYELGQGNLTKNASEALAREKRYDFLKRMAKKHNARIVTAHHQDDLIETIAINMTRGTGWRGLAVMDGQEVSRPLLGKTKDDLYDYALSRDLEWVEDETNREEKYLRNRLRKRLFEQLSASSRLQLIQLWQAQKSLRHTIDLEVERFPDLMLYSRYFLSMTGDREALEILRKLTHGKLTRPQLQNALLAVKAMKPGSVFEAGASISLQFSLREFTIRFPE
ncbi:MAG TPA: tRNA lysidine(34) synthetase TilS [Candidatus Saccharimonadales bacterium]